MGGAEEKSLARRGKTNIVHAPPRLAEERSVLPERLLISERCGLNRILLHANDQPARKKGSPEDGGEIKVTGSCRLPATARRLCAGDDAYAKKAKLGAAESGKGSPDERVRSDRLHPRRRPQPPGAFDRLGSRRPGKRFAWRTVSYRSGNV